MAGSLPDDTRGIVDPVEMLRHVDFHRFEPGDELAGFVEWFWSVAWNLPTGVVHHQQVLNHPAGNISVGTVDDEGPLDPADGRLYGVMTGVSERRLDSTGWTVAARLRVGGLGVFLNAPARRATDLQLDLSASIPGLDGPKVVAAVCGETTNEDRVSELRAALQTVVANRDQTFVGEAMEVMQVAAVAEHDRTVCRDYQLAEAAGTSVRTLQRLFHTHVGISPSTVVRRWRIIEAAEAARAAIDSGRQWRGWAEVAAELGYSDQAHLTRDFRRHLGLSPSAYLTKATLGSDS